MYSPERQLIMHCSAQLTETQYRSGMQKNTAGLTHLDCTGPSAESM